MKTIVCIGDSLVEGEGDETAQGGWVGRLQQSLSPNLGAHSSGYRVFNLGIGGSTIENIWHRLSELIIRKPNIIILGCGYNDIKLWQHNNQLSCRLPAVICHELWQQTLQVMSQQTSKILVTSGTTLIQDLIQPNSSGVTLKDFNTHQAFIQSLCEQMNISFLPIPAELIQQHNLSHGVHWNARGYQAIHQIILAKLNEAGWLK